MKITEYNVKYVGTIKDYNDWFLVQYQFDSVKQHLNIDGIAREKGYGGCLIKNEALDQGDYDFDDVVFFHGIVPGLDKAVYKLELA